MGIGASCGHLMETMSWPGVLTEMPACLWGLHQWGGIMSNSTATRCSPLVYVGGLSSRHTFISRESGFSPSHPRRRAGGGEGGGRNCRTRKIAKVFVLEVSPTIQML